MTVTPTRTRARLKPGAVVRCRTRRYLVEDVQPPREAGADTVVTMACMEDQAIGQRLTVFLEREIDFELLGESSWEVVAQRGFDQPRQFSAYLNTLRWNCVTATDPELFQAPYRAGIDVKAYQLEPLRKALQMPRVGLFIADDVGLGKTIEAGLILREMLLRQRIRRVVISCPPSVLRQWQEEMANRFGLAFTVMDRAYVAKVRQERGYGTNPWSTGSRFLISHALLRNSDYAAPLIDWLEQGRGDQDQAPLQSLLILDEAHNAAPASNSLRYAIDSGLTRSLRDLAPRFEHRIFLSATPHNGHSNSFTALLELLDPARFTRGVPFDQADLDAVLVRRLKDDLRRIGEDFPERIVEPILIPKGSLAADTPELVLSQLLQQYRRQRERRLLAEGASKRQLNADRLVITNLQKRLLSSVEAFARTLAVHQRTLESKQQQQRDAQLELLDGGVSADSDLAELSDDEVLNLEEAQIRSALRQTLAADQSDRQLLEQMATIAAAHRSRPDPRIEKLAEWLKQHLCPGLGTADLQWQPTRLLIFTDYVDTKRYLERQLSQLLGERETDRRVASFSGGMSEENRERLKAQFNADPDQEPLRILIATDAAREGVNLQNHCRHLIHFDIPWNPSKLEQRNGRIDRKLQRAPQVWCHYFLLEDRPEDRVMEVLVRKTEVIRQELGSLSPLVQRQVDEALEGGIDLEQLDALQGQLEGMDAASNARGALLNKARQELEASRRVSELQQQQVALRKLLAKSKTWLAFAKDRFRQALNCSLELLGVTGLEAHTDERGQPCWRLAKPEELVAQTRDKSWANTLDSLRGVKPAKAYLNDWRQEHPVRPVIFSDPGRLSAEAVHLHLEHRLSQRLLSRFLSQGFLHHELSRACVLPSRDPQPKVVVLGRLSLFGQGAARLHDELITVAAEWHPGDSSPRALRPLPGSSPAATWGLLQEALAEADTGRLPVSDTSHFQTLAQEHVEALLPLLQQQSEAALREATALLNQRAATEADALKEVLRTQRKRINATLRQRTRELAKLDRKVADADPTALIPGLAEQIDVPALDLEKLSSQERRQLAADQRHWARRLETIEAELSSEPRRIQDSYRVVTHRLEPAGLVYLWPISG
ncbi:DISARM system SNF2-like helicase DrmD [Cyanobium gracile]|uniref:DNA/RNA helicase, superfamily II, SNF2 family n=1 Tax=Cyanobium gracile (strain ATCC 27147 / PCC 6307) TaxID=292564 RepID=K9P6U8_CYAGP|nr:DISARM system SNF2-like helicase DrmD [Cyanobium gracile]AFY28441.1 DNA/RNA helicase, superfamily II, SNF2 family [Cyanobium gracile PCC 6307]